MIKVMLEMRSTSACGHWSGGVHRPVWIRTDSAEQALAEAQRAEREWKNDPNFIRVVFSGDASDNA